MTIRQAGIIRLREDVHFFKIPAIVNKDRLIGLNGGWHQNRELSIIIASSKKLALYAIHVILFHIEPFSWVIVNRVSVIWVELGMAYSTGQM